MAATNHLVEDLAQAIADGTPVDWTCVEQEWSDNRELLEELRLLATVARVHRGPVDAAPHSAQNEASDEPRYWSRLRLIERVGGGSFGDVYRAWDPRLHREVALKLIPVEETATTSAEAIIREGRLLARVRHSGVVTIYDAERIGSQVGLCMEFVQGPTLQQRIQESGPFATDEAITYGLQLCEALSAVHAAGVLHRDIKAGNVATKPDGDVVLMDFGAGAPVDTADGDLAGTPLYLAPEVLDGAPATAASDVYSLGVLLYYMVTGSYPAQARSVSELRALHEQRRSDASRDLVLLRAVPRQFASIIARACHPVPSCRYATATLLAEDIGRLQRRRRAKPWRRAAAAALVVFGLGVGLASVGDWGAREPVRLAILPVDMAARPGGPEITPHEMTSDLIALMERNQGLRLISTASVFSLQVRELPLKEIGAALGVSTVLQVRVQPSEGPVQADARLIRVADERMLWSARFEQSGGGLLELNRSIAAGLADALNLRGAAPPPVGSQVLNREAHARYLRGRVALEKRTAEGQRTAKQQFEQALAVDPNHAAAYAGLAHVYLSGNPQIAGVSPEEALRRAADASARALALGPSLPEAHVSAALVRSARSDWTGAEESYRRAIELAPNNVLARQEYSHWLALRARFEEGLEHAQRAAELDPLSARAVLSVSIVLRMARRFDEALAPTQKALALDPLHPAALQNLGLCYQGLGRLDEAIEAYQRTGRPNGNLAHALGQTGRLHEARALISLFEERFAREGLGAGEIAQAYIGIGELERAFEWLDPRYHLWPVTFKVAAVWDPLRPDPRFTALLTRYDLAEER